MRIVDIHILDSNKCLCDYLGIFKKMEEEKAGEVMYIFLDVDGVLNKKSDWTKPFVLNDECVKNFLQLTKKLGNVKIILSSSWRQGVDVNGKKGEALKKLNGAGITITDVTPSDTRHTRQEQIEYYIKRNQVKEYIVLDDDKTLFSNPEKINVFFTNYVNGLTKTDCKAICKMMKKGLTWGF